MHPWTRTLHKNAMRAASEAARRPARTRPLEARGKRIMGWFADDQLTRLKNEYLSTPGGPGFLAREMLGKIEFELSERKLDPRQKEA